MDATVTNSDQLLHSPALHAPAAASCVQSLKDLMIFFWSKWLHEHRSEPPTSQLPVLFIALFMMPSGGVQVAPSLTHTLVVGQQASSDWQSLAPWQITPGLVGVTQCLVTGQQ